MSNRYPEYPEGDVNFAERRRQRKQKLREEFFKDKAPALKMAWRIFVSSGILIAGVWLVSLPMWNLTSSNQIQVQGVRLLSANQLKEQIVIQYPLYIFRVQAQAIAAQLEKKAPVYNVVVKRSLFPLKLTVIVQERQPVANAILDGQSGYIDLKGVWISEKSYPPNLKKPELTVLGINQRVLGLWRRLYTQISRSPIKIFKLDFRSADNLILSTELGLIHCGDYTYDKMEKQIQMLDRLRNLPKSTTNLKFTHIDLINPNFPVVDGVKPTQTETKPQVN
ncbi:cell division septal protein [Synechococcus sp. PCC 7502]|uniref:cell division protein FtsQ/DivIB n=1 Tax=Synechococcus sp. PCC 7502 TaxID=1173263 RepID=UPI00029FD9D6|nr:FtsQ-type POTRA domain-containing protein [Synechococcus sp. PCC 7502]AFY72668.1 cell division septal protein [Synechococcus sp. PCC 7502]